MDELFRIVTQFLHVLSGILWIGGFYTLCIAPDMTTAIAPATWT